MEIITGLLDFQLDQKDVYAVTVGKFDGLHLGHQKIMHKLVQRAKEINGKSVVITFDVSPYQRLKGETVTQSILTTEEKRCYLEQLGIDYLIEYPFTDAVMHMSPQAFVGHLMVECIPAKAAVVGNDFHFGFQRQGNITLLRQMGAAYGFSVDALEKETYKDVIISSTVIREYIRKGEIALANAFMGHAYFLEEEVVHGRKLGQTLGMPTLNQIAKEDKLLPPFGVYATQTYVDGNWYQSVTNIGIRPTVSDDQRITVETNLLGYTGDLYGRQVIVNFLDFIRPEQRFASVDLLARQMKTDGKISKHTTVSKHLQLLHRWDVSKKS